MFNPCGCSPTLIAQSYFEIAPGTCRTAFNMHKTKNWKIKKFKFSVKLLCHSTKFKTNTFWSKKIVKLLCHSITFIGREREDTIIQKSKTRPSE